MRLDPLPSLEGDADWQGGGAEDAILLGGGCWRYVSRRCRSLKRARRSRSDCGVSGVDAIIGALSRRWRRSFLVRSIHFVNPRKHRPARSRLRAGSRFVEREFSRCRHRAGRLPWQIVGPIDAHHAIPLARRRIRFQYRVTLARTLRSNAIGEGKRAQRGLAVLARDASWRLQCATRYGDCRKTVRNATSLRQSTASQTIALPSRLEESAKRPSGEKATDVTSC